jgi:hypothetical protein
MSDNEEKSQIDGKNILWGKKECTGSLDQILCNEKFMKKIVNQEIKDITKIQQKWFNSKNNIVIIYHFFWLFVSNSHSFITSYVSFHFSFIFQKTIV